jgi:hypothetical protein
MTRFLRFMHVYVLYGVLPRAHLDGDAALT